MIAIATSLPAPLVPSATNSFGCRRRASTATHAAEVILAAADFSTAAIDIHKAFPAHTEVRSTNITTNTNRRVRT